MNTQEPQHSQLNPAAACCRPACVVGPGESSQTEQTLPSRPALSSPVRGGMPNSLEMS